MTLPVVGTLAVVGRRFVDDRGLLLASALAFSLLLCLAPLVLLLLSAMGFLLQSGEIADYVLTTANFLFPRYADEALGAVRLLAQERRVTGALGAAGLAVFASQLVALTRTVVNTAFRVRARRGLVHGFAFDLVAVAVLGLFAVALSAVILTVITVGHLVVHVVPPSLLPAVHWGQIVTQSLMYLSQVSLLFLVYRTFPNTGVPTRAAGVATAAVAVLWEAARWGFSAYLERFGVYGRLYGSFGVVVASLVWIYYSAAIFVLGAELAGVLSEQGRPEGAGTRLEARPAAEAAAPPAVAAWKYVGAAVVGGLIAIFALQNGAPTAVRFLVWTFDDVPLAGLVLGAMVLGALAVGLPLWVDRLRLRSRIRRLEGRRADPAEPPPP